MVLPYITYVILPSRLCESLSNRCCSVCMRRVHTWLDGYVSEPEPLCLICIFCQRSIFFSQFNFFFTFDFMFREIMLWWECWAKWRTKGAMKRMMKDFFLKWKWLYSETLEPGMAYSFFIYVDWIHLSVLKSCYSSKQDPSLDVSSLVQPFQVFFTLGWIILLKFMI